MSNDRVRFQCAPCKWLRKSTYAIAKHVGIEPGECGQPIYELLEKDDNCQLTLSSLMDTLMTKESLSMQLTKHWA